MYRVPACVVGLLIAVIIGVIIGVVCGFTMLACVLWCRKRWVRPADSMYMCMQKVSLAVKREE